MLTAFRARLGRMKGDGTLRFKRWALELAYRNRLPAPWADQVIKHFWDETALDIYIRWGKTDSDHAALESILQRYRPQRVLDAGCGTGRLFPLYQRCGVTEITGLDISATALSIARRKFPNARLRELRLEDLDYAASAFDLGVCNRVLQHVPPHNIEAAIKNLAHVARRVYINELTQSDDLQEDVFMRRHDYPALFAAYDYTCLETGHIGRQTYFIFGPSLTGSKPATKP